MWQNVNRNLVFGEQSGILLQANLSEPLSDVHGRLVGAGEGNRTLVCSLGSCRSTIELHPHGRARCVARHGHHHHPCSASTPPHAPARTQDHASSECRIFRPILQRGAALGWQRHVVIQRGVDIAFPRLARQFVKQLHAVTVRDRGYTGCASCRARRGARTPRRGSAGTQAAAARTHDQAGRSRHGRSDRSLRLSEVRRIDQRDVVMVHPAVAHAAVEPHGATLHPTQARRYLADLMEPKHLGPEPVRCLDVANIQHEVVEADRRHCGSGLDGTISFMWKPPGIIATKP